MIENRSYKLKKEKKKFEIYTEANIMDNNILNNNENENTQTTSTEVNAVEAPAAAQAADTAAPASSVEPQPSSSSTETAQTAQTEAHTEPLPHNNTQVNDQTASSDFSKYSDSTSSFVRVPRQTVYINNNSEKKTKAPKARLGAGAVAAVVAVCMVFSGGAAFAGTYIANKMTSKNPSVSQSGGTVSNGSPSVIFQSFTNGNKTAGTYEQVAEAVTPTVVEITTESVSSDSSFWGGSYIVSGAGSGVIISEDGLIITNNHVISGASTIKVKLHDGTEYPATLIGSDSDSDIAVIKIEASGLPCALIGNSDSLKVGQEVVAVGNPLGEFGGSVTNGIVSGLSRDVTIDGSEMNLIQTNAAVNPGNSGGGLFNLYGELIGVVNAKSSTTSSGTSVEGIGFAIPIDTAINVATELTNYGYVRGKVMLGISIIDIDNSWDAMRYGVNSLGVYVTSSDFEENDLRSGDRIVAVDDVEVEYSTDVKAAIKGHSVGDVITVKVVRAGKYVDVQVTLHEYVPTTASTDASESFQQKTAGQGVQG